MIFPKMTHFSDCITMMNMISGIGRGNPKSSFDQTSAFFNPAMRKSVVEEVSDCIGIDFGNNNVCVSYYKNQLFHVFQLGSKSAMPACLTLNGNEFFVGDAAKRTQKKANLALFDIKRCLTSGKVEYENVPYKFSQDYIFENGGTSVPFVRAVALIFYEIKQKVEKELEQQIKKVILTIPISFTLEHQQILVNACKSIGLEVLNLLFEPIATAITYYVAKESKKKSICVIDFGGGKLDVANISIDNGKIELLNYKSDLTLGGRDFDEKLVQYVLNHLKKFYPKVKLQQTHFSQIREKCIVAKESLTSRSNTNINLDFGDDDDIVISISQHEFEKLCDGFFRRVFDLVSAVCQHGNNCNISDVVLVGGSTRIPKIQHDLQKLFNHIPLNKTINPDEAIAKGAAIFGASLTVLGYIKTLKVGAEIPWDYKSPGKGSKMETFIDDGTVCRRITDVNDGSCKFDIETETVEIKKILEKNDCVNHKINEDEIGKKLIEEANAVLERAFANHNNLEFRQRNQINIHAIDYLNQCVNDFKTIHKPIADAFILKQNILQATVALNALDLLQKWEPAKMTPKYTLLKDAISKLSLSKLIGDEGLKKYDEFIKLYDEWLHITYTLLELKQKDPTETSKKEKAICKELDRLEDFLTDFLQYPQSQTFNMTALNDLIKALSEKVNQKNSMSNHEKNSYHRI